MLGIWGIAVLHKFDQRYVRFEAQIIIPGGQGMWGAFWLIGNDIGVVGWSVCAEIDVVENIGRRKVVFFGNRR